ncbi:hypothetical protein NC651_017283 [Populus alba x Populus x berolinensis]|nr:hypothetical protein NC651_017283 [Populus alba x Populus x berolinensis]
MSVFKKPLFLGSKFTILLFLITLAAAVTLVIAAKQSKFRASSMYSKQSNRHVQPSGPNPCSYLPGAGQCKPPKDHIDGICRTPKKILRRAASAEIVGKGLIVVREGISTPNTPYLSAGTTSAKVKNSRASVARLPTRRHHWRRVGSRAATWNTEETGGSVTSVLFFRRLQIGDGRLRGCSGGGSVGAVCRLLLEEISGVDGKEEIGRRCLFWSLMVEASAAVVVSVTGGGRGGLGGKERLWLREENAGAAPVVARGGDDGAVKGFVLALAGGRENKKQIQKVRGSAWVEDEKKKWPAAGGENRKRGEEENPQRDWGLWEGHHVGGKQGKEDHGWGLRVVPCILRSGTVEDVERGTLQIGGKGHAPDRGTAWRDSLIKILVINSYLRPWRDRGKGHAPDRGSAFLICWGKPERVKGKGIRGERKSGTGRVASSINHGEGSSKSRTHVTVFTTSITHTQRFMSSLALVSSVNRKKWFRTIPSHSIPLDILLVGVVPIRLAPKTFGFEAKEKKELGKGFSSVTRPSSSRSQSEASEMPSHKTFRIKKKLAKKMRQNRPIPHWIRMRTDNTIRYNAKRRHWRRTKLGF